MASESTLKDLLLNAPPYAIRLMIGLLVACVLGSLAVLAYPDPSEMMKEFRDVATGVLTITLPLLPVTIGVVSAASGSTKRIDQLVAEFLHKTIPQKLSAYIGFAKEQRSMFRSALFERVINVTLEMDKARSARNVSYCVYRLQEQRTQRHFDVTVKMNVFNFEIICPIVFRDAKADRDLHPKLINEVKDLESVDLPDYVQAVMATLHGALREGYAVSVIPRRLAGANDLVVVYGFRQKLAENFLGSPYLRRYFAEDATIAVLALFNELLASDLKDAVKGSPAA